MKQIVTILITTCIFWSCRKEGGVTATFQGYNYPQSGQSPPTGNTPGKVDTGWTTVGPTHFDQFGGYLQLRFVIHFLITAGSKDLFFSVVPTRGPIADTTNRINKPASSYALQVVREGIPDNSIVNINYLAEANTIFIYPYYQIQRGLSRWINLTIDLVQPIKTGNYWVEIPQIILYEDPELRKPLAPFNLRIKTNYNWIIR